jgi:hypothetical protein
MASRRHVGREIKRSFGPSVLVAVGSVVAWVYRLLFSGWDERLYKKNRRNFVRDIERSFAYLFSQHGGSVHPSEGENLPRAFDYVSVTLDFEAMRVQLIRGRGELDARIAPPFDPGEWREIEFFWQLVDFPGRENSLFAENQLDGLAGRLQESWNQLAYVLSEENWFPSLTNAEWRRFLKLAREEKLALRANMASSLRKPSTSGVTFGPE